MRSQTLLIALLLATASPGVQAAPEFLPLDADKLREMELESIPPFPAEIVLEGESRLWMSSCSNRRVLLNILLACFTGGIRPEMAPI